MAVRLRKMARELDRTPEDLLRLLQELGFDKYRTEDDMLADPVAEQLRRAAKHSRPRAVPRPAAVPAAVPAPAPRQTADADLMAALVPGVVRSGAPAARATPRVAKPPPPVEESVEALAIGPELDALRRDLAAARVQAERLQGELEHVKRERDELTRDRAALLTERDVARAERDEAVLRPPVAAHDLPTVQQLLEERGLRGADEHTRAVAALAAHHLLDRALQYLLAEDPEGLRRLLADRLVLAAGAGPENPGYATVTVSPDRADMPVADVLSRTLDRLGEHLLLNGWRRVVLVGVAPRWHGLLRDGVDRRVELTFRAVRGDDLDRHDLVVGWNADAGQAQRPPRITLRASSFTEFLNQWLVALAGGS